MRANIERCFNCGKRFTKSRADQMYCSSKCRTRSKYIPVPSCRYCSSMDCKTRNENKVYAPKECPERL